MSSFKQFKSRKLAIALQTTETTAPGGDSRQWEVHDVERSRGFCVTLALKALKGAQGKRALTEDEIECAIGLAVERALTTPPEKLPGTLYDVDVTANDLAEGSK